MFARKPLILTVFLVLLPVAAHAAPPAVAGIDQLLAQFQQATAAWGPRLLILARGTFGLLAFIDLWIVGYRHIMSGGEVRDIIRPLVHELIILGFYLFLLESFNITGPLIIQSFQYAAQQAGGIGITPNAVFAEGLQIATNITNQIKILHPAESMGLILCGLVVMGCFAWIAASMVVVITESYFIISAGRILLAFGGSVFTRDITMALLRAVAGTGLKFYVLQLIASVGTAFIANWTNAAAGATPVTFQGIMLEIGLSFVLLAITIMLPSRFERLVSHFGSGGAGDLLAAAGGAGLTMGLISGGVKQGILAAGGMGATGVAAGRLASTQLAAETAAGTGPTSSVGRAINLVGSTMNNAASAASTDMVRGLSGQRSSLGQAPWRMAADLNERNRLAKEGQNGP